MGNFCKTPSLTINTEVCDEYIIGHKTIMSTNNRAIFNEIYKQEQNESIYKLQQPLITQLPFISLDLIEPNQFIPQIKVNRRTLSFFQEKSPQDDNRSRTTSQKIKIENFQNSNQPIKSSLKSLNSKQGSSQKSQTSVRWGSDLSVIVKLIHYQNQLV
ncbi:unnamed protein product [Paramecium primaurelia]|uniref:Uncharacterized protein n=1 Tax=Paramecium primaurelia TaxID=5886 RepID=A0A8S1K3G2_PARPR|nr:unnamed protein product [Paramecium primaurelia]